MMQSTNGVEMAPRSVLWRRRVSRCVSRAVCGLLLGTSIALMAGCQTAPPAHQSTAREREVAALRALGFVETQEGWNLDLSVRILFDVDKIELTAPMRQTLSDMAGELLKVGIRRIRVEGHTDTVGSRAYNLELSRRRAEVVAQEFVRHGFTDATVERKGWAFEYPVASNDTPEGRALNRRVTIVVVATELAAN